MKIPSRNGWFGNLQIALSENQGHLSSHGPKYIYIYTYVYYTYSFNTIHPLRYRGVWQPKDDMIWQPQIWVYTAKKIQDQDPTVGPNSNNNTRTGTPLLPCEFWRVYGYFSHLYEWWKSMWNHVERGPTFYIFSLNTVNTSGIFSSIFPRAAFWVFGFGTISLWSLDQCHESRTTSSHGRCKGATPWRAAWNWPMLRCSVPLACWGWLISWKIPSL